MKPTIYSRFGLKKLLIINYTLLIVFSSCTISKQISHAAEKDLINDSTINTGHIGIAIYEPAANSYWYTYDATKYFIPASNTKLFTLYAGMKYLGDSLAGLKYTETNSSITILPTGDPTFLHKDFTAQPVADFLKKEKRKIYITTSNWNERPLGQGWAWDDYNNSYMVERSPFPICGNIVQFSLGTSKGLFSYSLSIYPSYFEQQNTDSWIKSLNYTRDPNVPRNRVAVVLPAFIVQRNQTNNQFTLISNITPYYKKNPVTALFSKQEIPFCTDTIATALKILQTDYSITITDTNSTIKDQPLKTIYSRPTDSLLIPMMHNSDDFFAEQILLMVSNERIGYMNDEKIIDTILNSDLKTIPQKPRWVDGSGLSRYNLFTPQDFVYILNKMKNEFGLKKLEVILPTGGQGTLKNYYQKDSGFIYAKTGSFTNTSSLSGFLITKKNKLLIFSIMANNFVGSGAPVRKAIEQFLENIREKY